MKTLTTKSQITAKTLKAGDCDYKGKRIGYDAKEGYYFIGSHFNAARSGYETIADLKLYIK